jgi:polyisoprenoid-binding protein YceI
VRFDPDNWRDATLEVDIPVSRLDLGDAKWNQATLARSLLDGERYPRRASSPAVEPIDARRAHVIGTLTLRGVSQESRWT